VIAFPFFFSPKKKNFCASASANPKNKSYIQNKTQKNTITLNNPKSIEKDCYRGLLVLLSEQ
jgi:hypothetical protein